MKIKQKKGISLIVLVITIIVMIILATAIILALNGSGIIGKAGEARTSSDLASVKEYVVTLKSEWLLEGSQGDFASYANQKLQQQGYTEKGFAVDESGEVLGNLSDSAVALLLSGAKIGDKVTGYTVPAKTIKTSGLEQSGLDAAGVEVAPVGQSISAYTSHDWRYIGISDDGKVMISPKPREEYVVNYPERWKYSLKIRYSNATVYGPQVLNDVAYQLYTTDKGEARSINLNDVLSILEYTGPLGKYKTPSGDEIITSTPQTIASIIAKEGGSLGTNTYTPDGTTDINTLKSDALTFDLAEDSKYINTERNKLVFACHWEDGYFLADSSVYLRLHENQVLFCMREVGNTGIGHGVAFSSKNVGSTELINTNAKWVRPVVELNDDVTFTYEDATIKLN